MKKKLEFTKVSPNGNITVLIWTRVRRKYQTKIAQELIDTAYSLGGNKLDM